MTREAIYEDGLIHLIQAGAAHDFRIKRGPEGRGWTLSVLIATHRITVRSRREPVRVWASLTAVGNYAEKVGIKTFQVDI